jgi:Putative adhesin
MSTVSTIYGHFAALLLAASSAGAQEPVDAPTFDWSGSVTPGATVRLDVGNGDLRVTASADNHMTVHGERRHGGLLFQAVTAGNDVTICAFRRGSRCAIDGVHGHFHIPSPVTIHTASADLTVALPPGATLIAHTSDGAIEVRGAGAGVTAEDGDGDIHIAESSGAVHAHTSDGTIQVDTILGSVYARSGDGRVFVGNATGPVEASTADGDVEVRLAAVDTTRIKAHTGDGTVTVYLPASFAGDVDARTSDGRIDSELSLPITGRVDPRHIHATLGTNGDARLELDSSNGSIYLKKL